MTEPASAASTFSLAVFAVAFLGPMAGPFALLVFAALSGALWAVAAAHEDSRLASAWILLRCTLLSVVLTSGLSAWIQSVYQEIPALELLAPVAFASAAFGNKWQGIFEAMVDAARSAIGRFGNGKSGEKNHE